MTATDALGNPVKHQQFRDSRLLTDENYTPQKAPTSPSEQREPLVSFQIVNDIIEKTYKEIDNSFFSKETTIHYGYNKLSELLKVYDTYHTKIGDTDNLKTAFEKVRRYQTYAFSNKLNSIEARTDKLITTFLENTQRILKEGEANNTEVESNTTLESKKGRKPEGCTGKKVILLSITFVVAVALIANKVFNT